MPIPRSDVLLYLLVQVAVLAILLIPAINQDTNLYFSIYLMEILSLTWLLPEVRDWNYALESRDKICRALLFFICVVQGLTPVTLYELSLSGGDEVKMLSLIIGVAASVVALLIVAILGNYEVED